MLPMLQQITHAGWTFQTKPRPLPHLICYNPPGGMYFTKPTYEKADPKSRGLFIKMFDWGGQPRLDVFFMNLDIVSPGSVRCV